jgi:type II secretory pathway pseudopilin PulG
MSACRDRRAAIVGNVAGMSLVEATIILAVLSVLTAMLAPSARTYVENARNVKAKHDVTAVGAAISQVLRDTGMLCLSLNGSSCANTATGRVELLVSGTAVGTNEPTVVATPLTVSASTASSTTLNWAGGVNEVADARRDLMDNQFVTNSAAYSSPSFTSGGGPRVGIGWRGPYLDGPIDVDPWGYAYQASTVFLATASDAADGTGSGQKRGGWNSDVVVISAGSNGVVQTAFGSSNTTAVGDDVAYVVQGTTR